jgi:hypothetical protein
MSPKKYARQLRRQLAAVEAEIAAQSAPPASGIPQPASRIADRGPIMWHFQHTHPELPNTIMNLCTVAPTIQEARGKAYLLAEAFTQNVIGFLRANQPPQLPDRSA